MTQGVAEPSCAIQLEELFAKSIRDAELSLPVMPDVAIKVRQVSADVGTSAVRLAEVIESDPAVAARIIRMTNSALYAGLSEITDLRHAIGRLGSAMVVAVVLGAAGKEIFHSIDPRLTALLSSAWKRSVYASAAARAIAPRAGIEPEAAFLAGLLHACGEPILVSVLQGAIDDGSLEFPAGEDLSRALAAHGPSAGARLLEAWGIPPRIVAAVAASGHLEPTTGGSPNAHVSVVSMAAAIGRQLIELGAPDSLDKVLAGHPAAVALDAEPPTIRAWAEHAWHDGSRLLEVF